VGALGCLGLLAAAQGVLHTGPTQAPSTPWPGNTRTNVFVIPFGSTNWLHQPMAPTQKLKFSIQTLPPTALPGSTSASPTIRPGVYKTFPYSCIVVVPGPHPDDRCIVRPPSVDSSMPIIKPELQFTPWLPP
jgi:hypothetical protein